MRGYVLIRTDRDDKKPVYVARLGMAASYTARLDTARLFSSAEEADRERCSNEQIVHVDDIMRRNV